MLAVYYHIMVKNHYGKVIGVEPKQNPPSEEEIYEAVNNYPNGAFAVVEKVYNKIPFA